MRKIQAMWHLAGITLAGTIALISSAQADEARFQVATFAGGCFWCMEGPFDRVDGVVETVSGYTGGHVQDPTYEQVSAGGTGHAEAVQVTYDPDKVSYRELLEVFWHNIDPTVKNRQFCDSGNQYRSAIFYHDAQHKALAERSVQEVAEPALGGREIHTEIVEASTFYPAEDYHQDYYKKNPIRYKYYRYRCGRDQRLEELWGEAGAEGHSWKSGS
jgi:peptide-methionine (S)-S-oxide reductase